MIRLLDLLALSIIGFVAFCGGIGYGARMMEDKFPICATARPTDPAAAHAIDLLMADPDDRNVDP